MSFTTEFLRFEVSPAPSRPAFTDFRASVEYSDRITGKQEEANYFLFADHTPGTASAR